MTSTLKSKYYYNSKNNIFLTNYFKNQQPNTKILNQDYYKQLLEYTQLIDKYNNTIDQLLLEKEKENNINKSLLEDYSKNIINLNYIHKQVLRNKNIIYRKNIELNKLTTNKQQNISYNNPIWVFRTFDDSLVKSSDILYSRLFNLYDIIDIKSKKTSQRKEILNTLAHIKETKKKYDLERECLNKDSLQSNIEYISLKEIIISNRKSMYKKYYSTSRNINYRINYDKVGFLDSNENIKLIKSLIELKKIINQYKIDINLLEQKENKLKNPSVNNTLNHHIKNIYNNNNNRFISQKILIINNTNYMHFITVMNNKLIKQLMNYQNDIQTDIQQVNNKKSIIELNIKAEEKENQKEENKKLKSKLLTYYNKKIVKLENSLTNSLTNIFK